MMRKLEYAQAPTDFGHTLKVRVKDYLDANGKHKYAPRQGLMAVLLLLSVFGVYAALLLLDMSWWPRVGLLIVLGVLLYLGGIHILHEGTHGNLSTHKKFNNALVLIFDLLVGFSSDQYRFRHLTLHHSFTNVEDYDADLDTNGLIRLSPFFPRAKKHAFQHFYAFLLYPIGIMHIIWVKDFKRFIMAKMGPQADKKWRLQDGLKLLLTKAVHLSFAILIPVQFFALSSVLGAYALVLCVSSMGIALVFQLSHINSQIVYIQGEHQDNKIVLDENLMEHQLKTTANYASDSRFVHLFTGGVNLQIEHHLFSNLSFWHLPAIRQIVKATCTEYELPYQEFPSFRQALVDHFWTLKQLGQKA